jgi:uncharacterized damage-inducible protein DinB
MSQLEVYAAHARYNRWMNDKLYAVAGGLTGEERRRNMGAFFKSIHLTFNHLLLADRIWLARFGAGEPPKHRSLGDELYDDFDVLRSERTVTDGAITAFVATLTDEKLSAPISYSSSAGPQVHPLWFAVSHMFNHQTHHRGQVTTLLFQLSHDPGTTDMIALLRAEVPGSPH